MKLRMPPAILRMGLRTARPLFTSSRLPISTKRTLVDLLSQGARPPRGTRIQGTDHIGGVEVERVLPPNSSDSHTLLYLHGGGYALGTARGYTGFAANLGAAAGMNVVLVEYRRAPEHPFPHALDDALAVYRALVSSAEDASKVVIAGDSAGGGLTLALAMALRDNGDHLPAALGLICPWADLAADVEHRREAGTDPLIIPSLISDWAPAYVGSADAADPLISPVYGDLRGLPPVVLHSAGQDPISVDAHLLEKLFRDNNSGAIVEHFHNPRRWHVYHLQVGFLRDADDAVIHLGQRLAAYAKHPRQQRQSGLTHNGQVV
ncbi:alpha/beta hydrolase [Rhodococcus sp. ARC_M6]|uniref:alpha/beta hydrolase n=1 Tax=Rhodococcus sp. ARC_M6 TaxID=2928852 RepID=UPI001FB2E38A|nr:alpha/beta hydrolase [Rhodococcus sp. ARC_M6]MCJ0902106.1 alpha/beta hydrolase [Rhodococcus sp. ARC_M6]